MQKIFLMLWISIIQILYQIHFQSLAKLTAKTFRFYLFIQFLKFSIQIFRILLLCSPNKLMSKYIWRVPPSPFSTALRCFSDIILNEQEQEQPHQQQRKSSSYFISILLSLYTNSGKWTKLAKISDKIFSITKTLEHSLG